MTTEPLLTRNWHIEYRDGRSGDYKAQSISVLNNVAYLYRDALIVGVFRSSVSLAGLDVLWQQFAVGVLIIVAVALDQWIRKVSS
jgi:hypothetical protein